MKSLFCVIALTVFILPGSGLIPLVLGGKTVERFKDEPSYTVSAGYVENPTVFPGMIFDTSKVTFKNLAFASYCIYSDTQWPFSRESGLVSECLAIHKGFCKDVLRLEHADIQCEFLIETSYDGLWEKGHFPANKAKGNLSHYGKWLTCREISRFENDRNNGKYVCLPRTLRVYVWQERVWTEMSLYPPSDSDFVAGLPDTNSPSAAVIRARIALETNEVVEGEETDLRIVLDNTSDKQVHIPEFVSRPVWPVATSITNREDVVEAWREPKHASVPEAMGLNIDPRGQTTLPRTLRITKERYIWPILAFDLAPGEYELSIYDLGLYGYPTVCDPAKITVLAREDKPDTTDKNKTAAGIKAESKDRKKQKE